MPQPFRMCLARLSWQMVPKPCIPKKRKMLALTTRRNGGVLGNSQHKPFVEDNTPFSIPVPRNPPRRRGSNFLDEMRTYTFLSVEPQKQIRWSWQLLELLFSSLFEMYVLSRWLGTLQLRPKPFSGREESCPPARQTVFMNTSSNRTHVPNKSPVQDARCARDYARRQCVMASWARWKLQVKSAGRTESME